MNFCTYKKYILSLHLQNKHTEIGNETHYQLGLNHKDVVIF